MEIHTAFAQNAAHSPTNRKSGFRRFLPPAFTGIPVIRYAFGIA
jgi:hypothetical protein